jgi:hypothetical protein
MKAITESLPRVDASIGNRIDLLRQVWAAVDDCGDVGVTSWEVLVPLRDQVTACLGKDPPDLFQAESLTSKAFALMSGITDA